MIIISYESDYTFTYVEIKFIYAEVAGNVQMLLSFRFLRTVRYYAMLLILILHWLTII